MKNNECWLPDIIPCNSYDDYNSYLEVIYQIFRSDFIDSSPTYKNAIVEVNRKIDKDFKKEESFVHVITRNYEDGQHNLSDREHDVSRTNRVPWIRPFITKCDACRKCNIYCDGIKVWEKRKGKRIRTLFLLEEERYLVVIEKRGRWYFLVTAYYIDYNHYLDDLIEEYGRANNTKTK